ncbi:MAG: HAD family hydrolase [Candidatus Acidiferrum sp.]
MKYRLAIFDFDGTLASSLEGISACMKDALGVFGYRTPSLEEVKSTVGLTLEDSIRILTKRQISDAQLPEVVKLYRELHDAKAGATVQLFDGVVPLLEELPSHGIKSVLVSNKGRTGLEQLLERLKIWPFFDLTLSAEDVEHNKPKPEVYSRHIAPYFAKISSSETLVIGDAEIDIRFAKAAGLASCWARYGYGNAAACHALHPDYEIGHIRELRDILRGGGRG